MKLFFRTILLITALVINSCAEDEDPCDVRHVIINGECVPDYIFPENQSLKNGDKYYHQKHGLIIYKDGHWFDENVRIIQDLEIKTEQ